MKPDLCLDFTNTHYCRGHAEPTEIGMRLFTGIGDRGEHRHLSRIEPRLAESQRMNAMRPAQCIPNWIV